ncbi:hypothetical protein F5Y05DRAFT_396471 [Hypoxylon sp. FL0543]|nr:hypothetical protein F5Y05DRAFT_396471 [Hypoxylon sp. FL0543]
MLVGVAEVTSQTKWSWFSQPRPLSHPQSFDEASRSVLRSLDLTSYSRLVACWTCSVHLLPFLSLDIGPFTQQSIESVPCL